MRHRGLRRAFSIVIVVAMLATAVAFALGWLSLDTTHGISMEPHFHTGDLVILRQASTYHVGEIVAYQSPTLHTIVLHRIIAEHGGLFSFKGDNNNFVDPQSLPASTIRGTLLLHIPRGGLVLRWLWNPLHAVPIAALIMGAMAFGENRRKRTAEVASRHNAEGAPIGIGATALLVIGLLMAAGCGLFTLLAARAPSTRTASTPVPYSEHLNFSYLASAPVGTTYPTGQVSTGGPVFLKLVHSLAVRADYQLDSTAVTALSGTIAMKAVLYESDGWSRLLAIGAPVPFDGAVASGTLALPLNRALALISQSAHETGLEPGGVSIVVTPTVRVHGTLAAQTFTDTMAPALTFQMSALELNLVPSSSGGVTPAFPQLTSEHSGTVQTIATLPGGVALLGHQLNGASTRSVGIAGLALALALILASLSLARRYRALSADERVRRRIHRDLISIGSDPADALRGVINVSSMQALADLALRHDVAVLDYEEGNDHIYYVVAGEIVYRYRHEPVWRSDANVVLLTTTSTRATPEMADQAQSV